jgi:hypothetical protein
MIYKVNVFENLNNCKDLRFILTNPEVITRVSNGYKRKVRSFVQDVTDQTLADWREQVTVEIRS